MAIVVSKIDEANVKFEGEISKSDIEQNVTKLAKEASKSMSVPGFRKGKVPLNVVKKRFGDKLNEDARGEAVRAFYDSCLKEGEIDPANVLGEPLFSKFEEGEASIVVVIEVGLKPTINLEGYEELIPAHEPISVEDSEVQTRLNELAQAQAPLEKIEEQRALANGDSALIDFKGFVDGKELEGGSAENFTLAIGSNQFIPGFEEQMVGMNAGESKEITVTFPEEYQNKDIAGKEAKFEITLHEIQAKKEVALDDELAKKMLPGDEEATLDKVSEKIKEQLINEKRAKLYNDELKPQIMEAFVEKFTFAVPNNILDQEINVALNRKASEMSEEEVKAVQESSEKLEALRDEIRPDALNSVKATFIIDSLAQQLDIKVDDQEVMQTVYYEAMQMGQDPKQALEMYEKQGALPVIKMSMLEDRLLTKVLSDKNA